VALDQQINITSRTTYNGCGPALPNIPIKAELKRYDMQKGEWLETLATKETTSDKDGFFNLFFEPLGTRLGFYTILVTGQYEEKDHTVGIEFPHNTKNYTITAEGKDFHVYVDAWSAIPLDIEFDQQNKKLTLDIDTSDSYKRAEIFISHELLDGEFTFFVNGVQRTDIETYKETGYSYISPGIVTDKTKIEIIGTTAIPEFPVAALVLVASIITTIFFSKKYVKV